MQSDLAGKIIVIALLCLSLLAWTVMIGKHLDLGRLRALNRQFEAYLQRTPSWLGLPLDKGLLAQGSFGPLVYHGLEAYRKALQSTQEAVAAKEPSTERLIEPAANAIGRAVARQLLHYESKMVFLASIVSGAPFLGLLGTVWGVMDAFGGLGLQGQATLQQLAPGVSGALLTTVAGLLVAIPSVFGYNFLLAQTKRMATELENFASFFADRLEREIGQCPASVPQAVANASPSGLGPDWPTHHPSAPYHHGPHV